MLADVVLLHQFVQGVQNATVVGVELAHKQIQALQYSWGRGCGLLGVGLFCLFGFWLWFVNLLIVVRFALFLLDTDLG